MDGVILDSVSDESWKYKVIRDTLREMGVEGVDKSTCDSVLGDKGYIECVKACEKLGLDPRETWTKLAKTTSQKRKEMIKKGHFDLYDGTEELLEYLKSNEVRTGLISNAPMSAVNLTIENYNLNNYFDFYRGVVNFEDLQARKPSPDHIELAKIELEQRPYIYVGDHESDVIAASKADIDSAWIVQDDEGGDVSPTYRIKNISELKRIVKKSK